ncbi:MAG: hypothetical protein HRT45_05590 [Bdellovibrionales bacterium]|nr:hypothetical protein [Bdellovibrionales bacterium]
MLISKQLQPEHLEMFRKAIEKPKWAKTVNNLPKLIGKSGASQLAPRLYGAGGNLAA